MHAETSHHEHVEHVRGEGEESRDFETLTPEQTSSDIDLSRSQSAVHITGLSNGGSNGISSGQEDHSSNDGHEINGGRTNGVNGKENGHTTQGKESSATPKPMPIAIVGMACRLPGDISTPDEFWELCSRSRSGWSEIPKERFQAGSFYHPNPGKSGSFNPKGGHFVKDLASFDAPFFNMTAQEAKSLDPQQRLLLECSFEALENAGIPKHTIAGKDVGVFIGGSFSEYDVEGCRDPETLPMYHATGMIRFQLRFVNSEAHIVQAHILRFKQTAFLISLTFAVPA